MEMRVNPPQKRGPFSEPLQPLASSRNRVELEEIRLEAESRGLLGEAKAEPAPERATGFTSLPVEDQKEEGKVVVSKAVLASAPERELPAEPAPGSPRWMFWKRPSKREQQMAVLKEGCEEMVGLMRSMKATMEQTQQERVGVKASLSPLPVAVASLRSLSKTQEKTGEILSELKTCVEQSARRETRVAESLGTFNETMASVGRTFLGLEKRSERSLDAMQQLSRRVEESDRMFKEIFDRMQSSEHEFSEQMARASQRGAFATVSACALLSLAIIFMTVSMNQQRHAVQISALPSPAEVAKAQVEAARTAPGAEEAPAGEGGEAGVSAP